MGGFFKLIWRGFNCNSLQVIHMHFWLKRNEICTQIEGWITELAKLQQAERVDRSMVLRRQYRQLREELAKLPMPQGQELEDLDQPFSATVLPGSAASVTASDLVATASTTSLASTISMSSTDSLVVENDYINISAALSNPDANINGMEDNHHGLG